MSISEKKCSCITDHGCHFPSLRFYFFAVLLFILLSQVVCLLHKTTGEIHSIGGLTVGGQTDARFSHGKVQIKLGQGVQGVLEFERGQGTAKAKRESLVMTARSQSWSILVPGQRTEETRGADKYLTAWKRRSELTVMGAQSHPKLIAGSQIHPESSVRDI